MATRLLRLFSQRSFLGARRAPGRPVHTSADLPDSVVVSRDGSTLICWHPPRPFLMEHTRDLPLAAPPTHPVMKVQATQPVQEIFRPAPEQHTRLQLQRLTYTTKHRWFPNSKAKYAKKNPVRDREYL